jgi:hypothetical protein
MKTFLSFVSVGILVTTYVIGFICTFITVLYVGLSLSASVGIISEIM